MDTKNWENIGVDINGEYVKYLRFVDDVALITDEVDHAYKFL